MIFNPINDNDQFFEVFEWLNQIGVFFNLNHAKGSYKLRVNLKAYHFNRNLFNLKQNIINIAIKVAKHIEGVIDE